MEQAREWIRAAVGYREENKASHQNISSLFPILCFAGYNFDFVYPPPLCSFFYSIQL